MTRSIGKRRAAVCSLTVAASMTVAACFPGLARAGRHIQIQNVARGEVGITHAGRDTTLTVSNGAIINYSMFNIPAGSVVTFVEPSAASRVLNRINSASPSQLDGSLNANGIVYFVNPAGIVFGQHSIVSAPALYAIAGKFSNSDFAGGANNFTASGAVSNSGQITAGSVVLVGNSVANSGSIVAGPGLVVMSMGGNTYLGQAGQSIYVQMNAPAAAAPASSASTAAAQPAVVGAGDMYWNAISSTGSIKASTIALSGGSGAVKVSGSLDASSGTSSGGTVQITGNSIAINHATINASGLTGGGTVDIGGGAHGKDPNIPDAQATTVDSSTVINAGDGGNVVVWSNLFTGFHGTVQAPAGWVETSSAGVLDVSGSSIQTPGGTWLMDPANVEITAGTDLDENETSTASSPVTFSSTASSSPSDTKISAADINTAINTDGDDVIITTHSALSDAGTITQDAGANISNTSGGARSLTLEAAGGITLNGTISASGSGNSLNVIMAAEDGTGEIAGPVALNNTITTNGGSISINAQTITQAASIDISTGGGMMDFEGGTFSAGIGSLLDSDGAEVKIGTADADGAITTTANPIVFLNPLTLDNDLTVDADMTGTVKFNSTVDAMTSGGESLTITSAGSATIAGNVGAITPLASLDISANGGAISLGGNVTTNGSGQDYSTSVTLTSASNSSQTFTDIGGSTVAFGSTVSGPTANLILDGGGGNDLENTVSVLSLEARTQLVVFNNITTSGGGQTYASVILNTATSPTLADNTGGDITFGGAVNGAGALTVETTGGIFLDAQFGHTTPLTSLTTQGYPSGTGGTTTINISGSPGVNTTAAQVYDNSVVLMSDTTLQSGGNIAFGSTLDGAHNLTTRTNNSVTLAGRVGTQTALTSLTTEGITSAATGATTISGAAVNTGGGGVTVNNPLTLTGATTTFSTVSGGTVLFASTVTGTGADLIADAAGGNTFASAATVQALTGQTATTLDNNVTTTKGQTYSALTLDDGSAQTLADNTDIKFTGAIGGSTTALTINSPLVELSAKFAGTIAVSAGGSNATVDVHNGGSIDQGVSLEPATGGVLNIDPGTYNESVAISPTLTLNNTNLGGVAPVNANSWSVTAPIRISGEFGATTASGFTFAEPVTLGGAVSLGGSGTASFASTINGGFGLTISSSGLATFNGIASAAFVQVSGATDINTSAITTTGTQSYTGAVTLSSTTTLTSTGNNAITFGSTVGGPFGLTIATTGLTTFGGGVSAAFVSVDGPADINSSFVTTSGTQNYTGAVTLAGATSLTSTANGAISFNSAVTGGFPLTVTSGGLTTYDGAVTVASLAQNGPADVDTAAITTSGGQDFNGAVTLSHGPTFSGTTVTFASTVTGPFGLTSTTSGATTFDGVVSAAAVQVNGPADINAPNVTTTGAQDYTGVVTLSDATTFTSTGGGGILFASTVSGPFGLSTATSGTTIFDGGVSAAFVQVSGPANINTSSITTTGTQNYSGAVTLLAGATLTSTGTGSGANITFGSTVNGDFGLTVATPATATFTGAVGGSSPLASVTLDNGAAIFDSTVAISGALVTNVTTFSGGVSAASVQVNGAADLNGGYVTTSGPQTYEEPVTLSSAAALSSTNAQPIDFLETVDGPYALTVSTARFTTFSEAVGSLSPLASLTVNGPTIFDAAVNVTGGLTSAATQFYGAVSAGFVSVSAPSSLGGITITTTGTQSFASDVAIGNGSNVLTSTGGQPITFGALVDGFGNLTVATSGLTTFVGPVGSMMQPGGVTVTAGPSLFEASVDVGGLATGNTTFDSSVNAASVTTANASIDGGSVTTVGGQTYGGAVTLGMATTLSAPHSVGQVAPITFDSTVTGPFPLTTATTALTTFDGNVSVSSLQVSGPSDVNAPMITTMGTQNYTGAVTLIAASTFASTGNGAITFGSAVSGPFDLTTMTGGESKFAGAVSVASLQVGIGPADINTSTITTSGAQNYAGAVTLSSSSTLSSTGGGAITFGSTLDGPFSLTVATAGTATFDGAVGGAAQLAGLTVTAGPSVFDAGVTLNGPLATAATQFNGTVNATAVSTGAATLDGGNVVTTGAQTYGGPVTVGADVVLNSGGGATTFDSTLSGPYIVTLTGSGLTTFNGGVNVGQLRVQGPTDINTASITTGATQTYIGPVTLSSDTTIASSGGENITFNSTVNGPYSLAVNTAGQTDFDGAVGGLTPGPLASLSVNSGFEVFAESVTTTGRLTADVVTFDGPVTAQSVIVAGANLNGGTITTTEGQSYGAVTLGAATVLTDNGGVGIDLHSTVTGPSSLTINSPATTEIDFPVNVKSLTINGPSLIGADITTSRTQFYNGAFAAYGTPTLTSTGTGSAADITFSSKVSGTQLTTASDGTTTFNGAVGTLTSLTTEGNSSPSAGTVVLDGGSVITDGAQNYQNAVVLGTGTTINSNGGQVTFGSTVDGNSYLNVYNSPTATFDGAVGGTTPLAQLDVSGLSTFQSTVAVTGVFLTGGTALNGDVRAGSVQIDGPSTINASSITSIGNEGPDGGGVYFFGPIVITDNTTLNGSNGYVTLGAGSVTARSGLWNLSVQSGQGITDNDDMTGLNNVSLIAGSVTSSTPSSAITVRGNIDGIAGNVSFTAPGGANTIDFNPTTSTSISISALGNVTFNRTSPLENNQYATIIGIAGTPNLVISLPGPPQLPTRQINLSIEGANVTFDQGEKLTAVGNVTIDALGGTAVLGDISAQGAIDVSADTINILERAPANLPTGVSDGTDYVGDSIAFNAGSINAIPVAGHTYLAPIFATPSITNISSSLATSGFIVEAYTSLPSLSDTNLFFGPTLNSPYLIDLQAEGNSIVDPATAIAGAVPRVIPQPLEDVATNPFQVKGLEAYLGITTTSPTYGDLIGFLQGAALYNDVPEGASTGTVTVNRLSSRAVADVLASFDNLFFAPVLGPDGRPVLDSRGVPQRRYLQSHIRDVFIAAQRSFIADEGAGKFTPLAFGDYILATPSQQEAADDLLKLQKLFTSMQQLGLSSAEFARSRDYILGEVAPPGMSPAQFYQTIMGQ